ncbi:MAG: muconolactone Delta-isomerase family protein [Syntrophaceae bacterium]|nr:muconolactone Delta-isomerase family protein [Syntrophaceae bacterium]
MLCGNHLNISSALFTNSKRKDTVPDMKFLVELDHVKTGQPFTEDTRRSFIESIIFPTLDKAEQLAQQGLIVAGGPAVGRIALRFIADVETTQQLDLIVSSLPLWAVSDTRVTPLIDFSDRRDHIQALLQRMTKTDT